MKFLANTKTAAVFLAVVILVFTPMGVKTSLERAVSDVEDMFYSGVTLKEENYTSAAIQAHLESRIDAALGLITVGAGYDACSDKTQALRNARYELMEAETISEKFTANEKLEKARLDLEEALAEISVSGSDAENISVYSNTLAGAQEAIGTNPYNDAVEKFISATLKGFPANFLKTVFSVESPEFFGGN